MNEILRLFSVLAPELLKDFKNFYLSLIALIFVKQEPSQKAFNKNYRHYFSDNLYNRSVFDFYRPGSVI